MRIFQSKNMKLFKKLVIFTVILVIIGFSLSGEVQAKDSTKGGKLLNPIGELLVFTGDGIMNIVHTVLYSQIDTTITVDLTTSILGIIATIAVGLIAAAAAAVLCVVTCGAFAAVLATIGLTIGTVGAGTVLIVGATAGVCAAVAFNANVLPDVIEIPVYQISPDKIFSNEILLFDVDFFNPKEDEVLKDRNGNEVYNNDGTLRYLQSTAKQLRTAIANWYNILRDIAIVVLLSILVYIGIRILISSASNDKAKYKQMLVDWIVAICLLFVMQYIMSFSNLFIGKVTELVKTTKTSNGYTTFIEDKNGKVSEKLDDLGYEYKIEEQDGKKFVVWPTNSLGFARLEAQMAKNENTTFAGYSLVFFILVLFTVYFIVTYLKRVLYMAFLTIIAPFVAMTYPLDKINDGKAQAFNMWFKEYIFNLLIQPMHLLLYTMLVTSAYELASTNIIYSLVALGFMMPAEKLLRKFFGFEKAQTPGLLAGPAGAAMTMSAMNKLLGKGPKGGPGKSPSGNSTKSDSDSVEKPPRINKDFDKDEYIFGNGVTTGGTTPQVGGTTGGTIPQVGSTAGGTTPPIGGTTGGVTPQVGGTTGGATPPIGGTTGGVTTPQVGGTTGGVTTPQIGGTTVGGATPQVGSTGGGTTPQIGGTTGGVTSQIGGSPSGNNKNKQKISKPTFKQRFGDNLRSYKPAMRYWSKGMKNKMQDKIKNAHPLRTGARMVAGIGTAAATGAIGLGVGLAGGDFTKAFQYTTGAALAGYKYGTGEMEGIQKDIQIDGLDEIQERAKYENEERYEDAKQQEYIEKYQKDTKNQFELERKYKDKAKVKEIMKNDIPEFINNGVTDMKDITTILEMRDNNQIKDIDEGIAIKKYSSLIGADSTKISSKKRKEWNDTFKDRFSKNDKYKNQDPDDMAKKLFEKIDAFNKIKYSK